MFCIDVEIVSPTPAERALMLSDLLSRTQHALSASDTRSIADILHGYLAGDISSLLSEAQRICWASVKSTEDTTQSDQRSSVNAKVTVDHLRAALHRIRPSGAAHSPSRLRRSTFIILPAAMQGASVENPNVKWSDIGGQEETKRALQEAVEWPITHKAAFRRLGISPPKGAIVVAICDGHLKSHMFSGVLLYGPPGCSKTLMAKALATESGLNFISGQTILPAIPVLFTFLWFILVQSRDPNCSENMLATAKKRSHKFSRVRVLLLQL